MKEDLIKRGGIYYVDLPYRGEGIQSGRRPCVVVTNNVGNKYSPVLHVVPLTTRVKKRGMPTHVILHNKCLKSTSIAMAEQEVLVSKENIEEKIGMCSYKEMKRIDEAIVKQNGLEDFIENYIQQILNKEDRKNKTKRNELGSYVKNILNQKKRDIVLN